MIESFLAEYVQKVVKEYTHAIASGTASPELSFRPHLDELLRKCCSVLKKSEPVHVVFEPSNTGYGRPDFRLHDSLTYAVYCYIETKALTPDPIDWKKHSEQLDRYLALGYPLILTDGIEFLVFEKSLNSGPVQVLSFAKSKKQLLENKVQLDQDTLSQFEIWLRSLLSAKIPQRVTRIQLMYMLAQRARLIRDESVALLNSSFPANTEEGRVAGNLEKVFLLFKSQLDQTLNIESFSSAIAQMLIFSLVVARNAILSTKGKDGLTPGNLISYLLENSKNTEFRPFRVLTFIIFSSKSNLGHIAIGWNEAALLLSYIHPDVKGIDDYHKIYEEFHTAYNPLEKMDFGVYATPKELANYLVKCIELILAREALGKQSLYSENVKVIDPGCGTGTFLEQLVRNYASAGCKEKCLATWAGIEILPVPYGLAQMRLDSLKNELKIGLRPTVLMGNSLSDPVVGGVIPTSVQKLSEQAESLKAELKDVIKAAKVPITVVLGNPPVSDKGFNMGKNFKLIEDALNDFRPPTSMRRNRMNILKPLQNDCIKFLRWASLKIEQSNGGIGAYVMPSSVLGDISYKNLRGYLKRNYDEIYILNIDQDLRQKGTKTESLFATQQGRSVIIFVKFLHKPERSGSGARLFYYDLNFIAKSKVDKINWLIQESSCGIPLRSFVEFESIGELSPFFPMNTKNQISLTLKEYGEFWPLDKIFLQHVSGIKTGCTGLLVHQDKERLAALLKDYADETISDDELARRYFQGQVKKGAYQYGPKRVIMARHLRKGIRLNNIREYQFRPFVTGSIYYDPEIMKETDGGRPRPELDLIFSAKNQSSIGLAVAQNPSQLSNTMDPFVCAIRSMPDNDLVRRGNAYIFTTNFPDKSGQLVNNINSQITDYLARITGIQDSKRSSEALVYYCYAVLNSFEYLKKYKDVIYHNITASFVRVPLTLSNQIFKEISSIGENLFNASLGLLPPKTNFSITGNLPVEIDKFKIIEKLIIGMKASKEVFRVTLKDGSVLNYMTGGYNVVEEWLKRRTVYYLHRQFEKGDLEDLSKIISGIENHFSLQPQLSVQIESLYNSPILSYSVK